MSLVFKFIILLIFLVLIISLVSKFIRALVVDIRENKIKMLLIKIAAVVIVIFSFNYMINARNGWSIPVVDKQYEKYVINLNEEKVFGDTKIRINDVLIDFNKLDFNVGIKGKDKLVAVEVKENLKDVEPLISIKGLWLGKKFIYSYNAFDYSYKSESFIDSMYIICYLSNGEEVSFKVNDTKDMKSLTKIIHIDKDFQEEGEKIRFRTFTKGATYGELYMVSDLGIFNTEVSIFIDGKEYKNLGAFGTGGQQSYNTPPIGDSKAYVKIKVKSSGKEYKVNIQ
ncbi:MULTISPECIES: hypothetical protein [Clostridium]|uniref:Uncharacterized protein n=1 Tax=Clostridium frigoriphilum TaxID=443253 RepID=A0ABU7UUG9_9CLOT|nr:hypothetical protein [Clostridium sp. DSM 17811]MBU3101968.1 hypothetical protein [Clostridium sp. DSM 17811]